MALLFTAAPGMAMRFSHDIHQEAEVTDCRQCHQPRSIAIIPERQVCLECHSEEDIVETDLGPTKTHTPVWTREHGRASQEADAQCSSCHTLPFCADCHRGGELNKSLAKRDIKADTAPRSHTSRFLIVHPLKALGENASECYTCHQPSFCSDCHEAYKGKYQAAGRDMVSHQKGWAELAGVETIPGHADSYASQCEDCHPGGSLSSGEWSEGHAREARRNLASCQSCHPDGQECLICHSADQGLQISPHPRNWRSIQRKFKQESPEVCAKCHLSGI
jgi:hypothetical protein